MTRNNLFWLAGGLAVAGVVFLIWGISLMNNDIRSHLAANYQEYGRDSDGAKYACTGRPQQVASEIAQAKAPEAQATDRGSEYLRYNDDIVIVGPDAGRPCSIRVEDTDARYSGGGFIFLGPGFTPGSPSGGSGGSPGGPDGSK
ncbi:DUF4247 domain-containing protein [Mycobacterium deserti]|uniref:DUF4247 domain-containing protein n=1 Tax=Mycobacterium deserti TaxID=2978347 RepID=A0ABT2MAA9_9MYCO|nr:DUF4247 domain-containing protein [Mycobacterium deserti]MCT7659187.1 DUF4247 domain-containing protein [Mycobacterium deserti]